MAEFEPNNWQKLALANIHVIDKPGEWGTCVHVNFNAKNFSRTPYDIRDTSCYPIGIFDPQNSNTLPEELTPELAAKIREELVQARPDGHAFKPTESEQLKIDRIFVELAKYPELSHLAFDPRGLMILEKCPELSHLAADQRGLVILAGDENFGDYYKNNSMNNPRGNYTYYYHRIVLGDDCFGRSSDLRSAILEEVLHSIREEFDGLGLHGINLTPVDKMQAVNDLVKNLENLYFKQNFAKLPCARVAFTLPEQEALAAMTKAHEAYMAEYPKFVNRDSGALLRSTLDFINELTAVYTHPIYINQAPQMRKEELYVKLMKGFVRSGYRKEELAELFLKVLDIPEVPDLAEGLRHDHNQLLAKYRDTILLPERIMGKLYVESVARRVEAQGIATGFNFGRGRG